MKIEIWNPRYHDRMVLVAAYKVGDTNDIVFTKAKHLKGKVFRLNREDFKDCKLTTNGTIQCYEVALDKVLEREVQNGN
jgi:hypothetical protein